MLSRLRLPPLRQWLAMTTGVIPKIRWMVLWSQPHFLWRCAAPITRNREQTWSYYTSTDVDCEQAHLFPRTATVRLNCLSKHAPQDIRKAPHDLGHACAVNLPTLWQHLHSNNASGDHHQPADLLGVKTVLLQVLLPTA